MKKILGVIAAISLVAISACQPGAKPGDVGKPVSEINVYNWFKYMPLDLMDDFSKETGIKVNYEEYESNEEMLAKLNAGGKYDLVFPGVDALPIMIEKGLLAPIDKTKVPNFANVDPSIVAAVQNVDKGNQYSLPYNTGVIGLIYWKDQVPNPNTAIDSISMLLKPELKGKIFVLDDMREVYGAALCGLGYSPNSTVPSQVDAATKLILKWKDQALQFTNDYNAGFKKKEAWVVLGYPENIIDDLSPEEKKLVDVILPKEKTARYLDSMAIPKDAKNIEGALKFIDFIYRPESLARIADLYGYPGISEKSKPFRKKSSLYSLKDIEKYELRKPLGDKLDLYAKPWEEKIKVGASK